MHIEHINERRERIEVWNGASERLIPTFVKHRDPDKYPLLSGIEPYQDTYFNTKQIVDLVNELNNFKAEFKDDVKQQIDDLIKFAKKIDIHEYLRFVGD